MFPTDSMTSNSIPTVSFQKSAIYNLVACCGRALDSSSVWGWVLVLFSDRYTVHTIRGYPSVSGSLASTIVYTGFLIVLREKQCLSSLVWHPWFYYQKYVIINNNCILFGELSSLNCWHDWEAAGQRFELWTGFPRISDILCNLVLTQPTSNEAILNILIPFPFSGKDDPNAGLIACPACERCGAQWHVKSLFQELETWTHNNRNL